LVSGAPFFWRTSSISKGNKVKRSLEQYVKKVQAQHDSCCGNEAATKAALIAPLFDLLGYDLSDPRECKPEHKADFGKSRSIKPVDWAFCLGDARPAFLVEAKAIGEVLDDYDEQLGDYFGKEQPGVVLGILTNGVQWRFFTDFDCDHVMDKQPFFVWNVLSDAIPCEFLSLLQRSTFNADLIKAFASRKQRLSLLVAELSAILKPSPDFVKLAVQNLEDRNLTEKVVEEWTPILTSAIQEWAQQQRLATALGTTANSKVDEAEGDGNGEKRAAVSLEDLIAAGILAPPLKLIKCYHDTDLEADLEPDGTITFQGESYSSPTPAAEAAARQVCGEERFIDGWHFWKYEKDGEPVVLDKARHEYMAGLAQ
jgi:predicted type IV restriction endonuclease